MLMIVSQTSENFEDPSRFARLMQQGQLALTDRNPRRAHRFWREAAMLNPTSEAVWLALLQVIHDEHDRQVCLQNIVAINPNNLRAQQELNSYNEDTAPSAPIDIQPVSRIKDYGRETLLLIGQLILAILAGVLLAPIIIFLVRLFPV